MIWKSFGAAFTVTTKVKEYINSAWFFHLFVFLLLENRTIFIVGPTVVSGSAAIQFEAIYPFSSKSKVDGAKWFMNNSPTAIDFDASGYDKRTLVRERITQSVRIPNKSKNAGTYRVTLDDMLSNSIDVIIDGMFLMFLN